MVINFDLQKARKAVEKAKQAPGCQTSLLRRVRLLQHSIAFRRNRTSHRRLGSRRAELRRLQPVDTD